MLSYWMYSSKATTPPTFVENASVFLSSKTNNDLAGITGRLYEEDGRYLQYIEGPSSNVQNVKHAIVHDWRHEDVVTLSEGVIAARKFFDFDIEFEIPGELPHAKASQQSGDASRVVPMKRPSSSRKILVRSD